MILDFLFPKRCVQCKRVGDFLCPKCFAFLSYDVKSLCLLCQRPSVDSLTHPGCKRKYSIDGSFSAIPYNKTAQKLIYNFKYKPYLSSLSNFLTDLLYESLIQNEIFGNLLNQKINWVLVPIPLSEEKFRKRGYNQAEILAKELGKRLDISVLNLLTRVKETKSQFGLKLPERKNNIRGAFSFKKVKIGPKTGIFLVDDIVTTGSTLMEASNILKREGVQKVIGITLARD